MSQQHPFIESSFVQQDLEFEVPLRPQALSEFQGQRSVRDRLEVVIHAARERGEPVSHTLFCGPPGLGKTTLASIVAKSMDSRLVVVSGPVIEKPGDLAGILTNLQVGDVLFVDEIHRLNRTVEEYLYPAMEDFALDLIIDTGPNARSVNVKLNPFTLIGATTRQGALSAPLRSRFGLTCRLDYYDPETLGQIILRSSRILDLKLEGEAAAEIARRARGTPRIANNLLRWVRDFAQVRKVKTVDQATVHEALSMLSIDELGLDEMDKRILTVIVEHYDGGPVGLSTLAVAVGEEKTTIEEVYEPFLILQGFLKRTPRGREATQLAYKHLEKWNM